MVQIKTFGKYEIVRKLGRSMTDVYLAHDPEAQRPVVLKVVEQSRDEYTQLVIEAERRGAQIQKQLHEIDPRILEIYDCGEQDGCFFVAMEYFSGKSIAEILTLERRLDPLRAVKYAAEVCSQLDRLHSFVSDLQGQRKAVVHGDIKPSNIQIGAHDELRLLDFGIAKVITYTHNLTHHNLGSPTYCSPERLSKAQVDPQADLWAVGVSLYEMIAGSPPYQAQDTRKLENLIQSRRPPRALPASCPAQIRAVVSKALHSDIRRRYGSAAAMESDLRAILLRMPTSAEHEESVPFAANETIRRSPEEPARKKRAWANWPRFSLPKLSAFRWPSWRKESGVLWALAAGLLCGMLFVPLHYMYGFWKESRPLHYLDLTHASAPQVRKDWNLYQRLERENAFLGRLSPAASLAWPMRRELVAAADEIIDAYRNSSDPAIHNFDWKKARVCLYDALQLSPGSRDLRGKLALADGYVNLIANPKLPGAAQSEKSFLQAAAMLPRSPDPHLALARLYTYAYLNAGKAAGEFTAAERLGYHFGPREQEQQADGFLFRAEYELRQAQRSAPVSKASEDRWLAEAANDLDRARVLYEPISGFSHVSATMEQLYRDTDQENNLKEEEAAAEAAKLKAKHPVRRTSRTRHKQLASNQPWQ